MKVIQINSVVNSGSTGRITEDIGKVLQTYGHESVIAFGRFSRPSASKLIPIGDQKDIYLHGVKTVVFDRHGFGSRNATLRLIQQIEEERPDVVGLHNLHGYYINIEILFEYLKQKKIPVLWTLFDCWAFTGHCSYFDSIDCTKWKTQCETCPKKKLYPSSYFIDNSYRNYTDKKRIFTNHPNLRIVVHSMWLKRLVEASFLKGYTVDYIHSGIDMTSFKPYKESEKIRTKYSLGDKKIILGVASIWDKRKGLDDFVVLNNKIDRNRFSIVLVGLNEKQLKNLAIGIKGISRTESVAELAALYSVAEVFVNPTWQDNFPTTNLEALACGTPVITYNTGGSPEAIDESTGLVVEKGDINGLYQSIYQIAAKGKEYYSINCRARAERLFNKDDRYFDYLKLYETMLNKKEDE